MGILDASSISSNYWLSASLLAQALIGNVDAQTQVATKNAEDTGDDSAKNTARSVAYIIIVAAVVLFLALIVLVTRLCTLYDIQFSRSRRHLRQSIITSGTMNSHGSGSDAASIESGPVSVPMHSGQKKIRIHASKVEDDSDEEQPPVPPKKSASKKLQHPLEESQRRPLLLACIRS